jgi:hypothetical protein
MAVFSNATTAVYSAVGLLHSYCHLRRHYCRQLGQRMSALTPHTITNAIHAAFTLAQHVAGIYKPTATKGAVHALDINSTK